MYQKDSNLMNEQKKINTAYLRRLLLINLFTTLKLKGTNTLTECLNGVSTKWFVRLNSAQGSLQIMNFLFYTLFVCFAFPFLIPHFLPITLLLTWDDLENSGIKAVTFWSTSQALCSLLWVALFKLPASAPATYWECRILSKLFLENACTLVVSDLVWTIIDLW